MVRLTVWSSSWMITWIVNNWWKKKNESTVLKVLSTDQTVDWSISLNFFLSVENIKTWFFDALLSNEKKTFLLSAFLATGGASVITKLPYFSENYVSMYFFFRKLSFQADISVR